MENRPDQAVENSPLSPVDAGSESASISSPTPGMPVDGPAMPGTAAPIYGTPQPTQQPFGIPAQPPFGAQQQYSMPQQQYGVPQPIAPPPGTPVYPAYPYPPTGGYYVPYIDPKALQLEAERKAVKRTANHIGLGLIFFTIISLIVPSMLMAALMGLKKESLMSDSAVLLILNLVITLIGFSLAAFFISRIENQKISQMVSFGAPRRNLLVPAIMTGIGFCFVADVATSILQSNFSPIMPFGTNDMGTPKGVLGMILSALCIAVFPALLEELLFRGAIMGSLLKFGKGFAVFTSALIFGLMHGNLVQIPFAFMVGLVLGFAVLETNSIWTSVIIHFINNFISVVLEYVSLYCGDAFVTAIYCILVPALIMVGFFGIYLVSRRDREVLKYEQTAHLSTAAKRVGWVSGSAAIIVFYVFIALEVLSVQLAAIVS